MEEDHEKLMAKCDEILNTCAMGLYKTKVISCEQFQDFVGLDLDSKTAFCHKYSQIWLEAETEKFYKAIRN